MSEVPKVVVSLDRDSPDALGNEELIINVEVVETL